MRRLPPVLALALALGCSGSESGSPGSSGEATPEPRSEATSAPGAPDRTALLVKRGRVVYSSACIACHAPDPTQVGGLGPPIAGSSLELLRAKVLYNEYPPGYTPKRETRNMVPLPHLESDLPALAAYLEDAAG
jgi:mono/diheme cytochrome c family protein